MPQTSKELILEALSRKWPLTAKEIHNQCRKQFDYQGSYQAIHKMLKELSEENKVESDKQKYRLSFSWILKNKESSENLFMEYMNPKSDSLSCVAHSLHEADMFIINFVGTHTPKKKEPMCWLWSHYWIPLFLSMEKYQGLKIATEKFDVYSAVRGRTPIDIWCAEFWGKYGAKVKYGVDYGSRSDTVAFSGYVLEAHYPKEIMKKLEEVFSKATDPAELDINKLFEEVFMKETKIPITVAKNEELAEQIIEETLKYFT